MNKLGFKALLIDKNEANIGGDCLNTGCVPSKALIHISRIIHEARQSEQFGLEVSGKVDADKVMQYVQAKQDIIRHHENADYFRKEGLDVVIGEAKFESPNSIRVGEDIYAAKKYVIATGSRPRKLDLPGLDYVKTLTHEGAFDLSDLPTNMTVIGAGPIGLELGQAFNRLGVNVSVVDIASHILPKEDPEIAEILKKKLEEEGIKFYMNSSPLEVSEEKELIVEKQGEHIDIPTDTILFAVGRSLNHDALNLNKANVKVEDSKVKVNDYLRTTNKRVYVCGDAVGSLQFSHGAELHARIILNNFFSPIKKKLSYKNFSWVTFTSPEIATFGLTEQGLKDAGIRYEKLVLDFKDDDRAIVDDYQYGKSVLFIQPTSWMNKNPKILGGSMIAPNAGELIQELILANYAGLRINTLFNKIYPYPTASRVNQAIVVNKKMLDITPTVKKLLKFIY